MEDAPGRPTPPRGFAPPVGWHAPADWLRAPDGWRYWRFSRSRLLAVAALVGMAAVGLSSIPTDLARWHQDQMLDRREVTTTARVLAYHYDPDGGDPGGWTTDRVRFSTANGQTVTTTVGHHDPGPEAQTRRLAVTYDPAVPDHARPADYIDDRLSGGGEGQDVVVTDAVITLMATVGALATAVTLSSKNLARQPSVATLVPGEPSSAPVVGRQSNP